VISPRALILDSNVFPKGQYSGVWLGRARSKIDSAVEWCIPEVVVWELAEHAFATARRLSNDMRTLDDVFIRSRLEVVDDIDGCLEAVRRSLADNGVRIVATEPTDDRCTAGSSTSPPSSNSTP
jgi:rRNA-processing protein FCF1